MLSRFASKLSFVRPAQRVLIANKSTGKVKVYFAQKGFGFIVPDDGSQDVFVHQSSVKKDGFRSLQDGEAVEFDIQQGANDSKIVAINVTGPNGADVLGTPQQPRTNSFSNDGGDSRGGRGGGGSRNSRDRRDHDSDYY